MTTLIHELNCVRELLFEEQIEHANVAQAYEGLLRDLISTIRVMKTQLSTGTEELKNLQTIQAQSAQKDEGLLAEIKSLKERN